jgi:hypothetical protein
MARSASSGSRKKSPLTRTSEATVAQLQVDHDQLAAGHLVFAVHGCPFAGAEREG